MPVQQQIYLVDDDAAVCHALSIFLVNSGYRVNTFPSAEDFLDALNDEMEGVMLLDQRMTGMTGLQLQAELGKRGNDLPIIFITGHGDVRMSVNAIKAGAVNFLEKPFSNEELLGMLMEAFASLNETRKMHNLVDELRRCHASLTEREREVMRYVVAGMSNRALADQLGVSDRTIEVHRARGMKKMGAESLPDLVRKYALCQQNGVS
jgi:RNA polymerase sigma factor (sigma-70 family)